jgi:uncharacterized protein YegL
MSYGDSPADDVVDEPEPLPESTSAKGRVVMPFYLVVDVSGSMRKHVAELNQAVDDLVAQICRDPVVDDYVMMSIISFSTEAKVVMPLGSPSEQAPAQLSAGGGTHYGNAFQEYHRTATADRQRLKVQGMKVFRSCVFFLSDGAPGDRDCKVTFRSLFSYDPASRTGNAAFPYFVPIGFGPKAPEKVLAGLAYPDFGPAKGKWFINRAAGPAEILRQMGPVIGNTMVGSGLSAGNGEPRLEMPTFESGSGMQFGEAGDYP